MEVFEPASTQFCLLRHVAVARAMYRTLPSYPLVRVRNLLRPLPSNGGRSAPALYAIHHAQSQHIPHYAA
jgi:hypothetical protein